MSRQTVKFEVFGRDYKTTQLPAQRAIELMRPGRENHPCELLEHTYIKIEDRWIALDDCDAINLHVSDIINVIAPRQVLQGVMSLVNEYNYGFIERWRGVKIPSRFIDGSQSASSSNVDPLIAQIISDKTATMRELEEYYSLEDAFKMFDVAVARGVNQALSSEAAAKSNGKR